VSSVRCHAASLAQYDDCGRNWASFAVRGVVRFPEGTRRADWLNQKDSFPSDRLRRLGTRMLAAALR
jgi:hypothetical protein